MTFIVKRDGHEVCRFRAAKIVRQRFTLTAFSADGKLIGSFFTSTTKDLSIEQVEEPKNE